jgi:hypothetical protein
MKTAKQWLKEKGYDSCLEFGINSVEIMMDRFLKDSQEQPEPTPQPSDEKLDITNEFLSEVFDKNSAYSLMARQTFINVVKQILNK